MDLNAEVDIVADGCPHGGDHGNGIAYDVGGCLALKAGEEGSQAQREIAGPDLLLGAGRAFIDGCAMYVAVDLDPVANTSSQQLMHGLAYGLAGDVPQSDVDSAEGGAERGAHKVGIAADGLVMMFDAGGVLANVVFAQVEDSAVDHAVMCPEAGLAVADEALVGVDPHQ